MIYVEWQNSSRTPHNTITTDTLKRSYNYAMMGQMPDGGRMPIYAHDGPITIAKQTRGAVFCSTTSEYGMKRDGASCFDMGHHVLTSTHRGHFFKESILARARRPVFSSFRRPFSQKAAFLFLHTKLAHLPVPIGLFRPIHTHTLNQLQKKRRNKTNPRKPAQM